MKKLLFLTILFANIATAQTKQKVWKQFVCNQSTYRVLRISFTGENQEDSIYIQKNTKGKWISQASYFAPSEGAIYKDVNADGCIDVSLQMRFAQVVFLYNPKQKKYIQMGEVGYDGFEKIAGQQNSWFTFIQYKKTHEWWAQLFTIVDGKKQILHELVAEPNHPKDDDPKYDELFDTSYDNITYKTYINGTATIQQVFKANDAEHLFNDKEDEMKQAKKWLIKKYKESTHI